MSTLMWKDLRHHARQWLWSLLVATAGAAVVGIIVIAWWSATQWSLEHGNGEHLRASSLIGSNLVGYAGLATAIVISTTLSLTVTAQQRSHALWKVLGIPGSRIRAMILWQVGAVGVIGGLLGGLLALPLARIYLLTWREFDLFPRNIPLTMPAFSVPAAVLVTALFSVLGGLGAARRAANVPEMQALREAAAPTTRTRVWQWIAAGVLVIGAASLPIFINLPADVLEEGAAGKAEIAQLQSPGGRALMGGAVGFMAALAALFVPNWTLRPLLVFWTRLIPSRSPAWFSARKNARHRSALSMTTIVPFAIAVSMTGTIHAIGGAARSGGMSNGVNGFLTIMVPIFFIAGIGGVANIAMVGRTRRQEGALLGVIGARPGTVLRSTALEGAIYAGTGILFGLATTLLSAVCATAMSGGGAEMFASAIPVKFLLAAMGASLVLAVATTWLPARLDRRALMDNLRQPV